MRYYGWEVADNAAFKLVEGEEVHIPLQQISSNVYQGWWPWAPEVRPHYAVSGICLWDARWQIEFAPIKKNPPGRKVLSQTGDREEVFQRLRAGMRAQKVYVPSAPGPYHHRLLTWQVERLRELAPEVILYHLPEDEYLYYIRELEQALGLEVPEMHRQLLSFAAEIQENLLSGLGDLANRVRFVHPLQCGATRPEESWPLPYHHPELFGVDSSLPGVGLETLDELRSAWSLRHTRLVPVACLVPGLPDPYSQKLLTTNNSVSIAL